MLKNLIINFLHATKSIIKNGNENRDESFEGMVIISYYYPLILFTFIFHHFHSIRLRVHASVILNVIQIHDNKCL